MDPRLKTIRKDLATILSDWTTTEDIQECDSNIAQRIKRLKQDLLLVNTKSNPEACEKNYKKITLIVDDIRKTPALAHFFEKKTSHDVKESTEALHSFESVLISNLKANIEILIASKNWIALLSPENQLFLKKLEKIGIQFDCLVTFNNLNEAAYVPLEIVNEFQILKRHITSLPKKGFTCDLSLYCGYSKDFKPKDLCNAFLFSKKPDTFSLSELTRMWKYIEALKLEELKQRFKDTVIELLLNKILNHNEIKEPEVLPFDALWSIGRQFDCVKTRVYTLVLADDYLARIEKFPHSAEQESVKQKIQSLKFLAGIDSENKFESQMAHHFTCFRFSKKFRDFTEPELISLLNFLIDPLSIKFEEVFYEFFEVTWKIGDTLNNDNYKTLAIKAADYAQKNERSGNSKLFLEEKQKDYPKLYQKALSQRPDKDESACTIL